MNHGRRLSSLLAATTLTLVAGTTPPPVPAEDDLSGRAISGRVVGADGQPVAEVLVTAAPGDDPDSAELARSTSAADGRFRLDVGHGGTYRVRALHRVGQERQVALTWAGAEGGLELRLAPPAEVLTVSVTDSSGAPVPRFLARWWLGARETPAVRGEAGLLELPWHSAKGWHGRQASAAPARVEVWDAADAEGEALLLEPLRHGPVARGSPRADLRLRPASALAGRLVGPDGKGVAGVRVLARLARPPGEGQGSPEGAGGAAEPASEPGAFPGDDLIQQARTNADGRFAVAALASDLRHALRVELPATLLPLAPWAQLPGEERLHALRAAVSVVVTLRSTAGEPVPSRLVEAWPLEDDGTQRSDATLPWARDSGSSRARSDADGVARLEQLDPERSYRLSIRNPVHGVAYEERTLTEWRPADTRLTLKRLTLLEGVVRDDQGRLVRSVQVLVRALNDRILASEHASVAGRFRFVGLAEERVRVSVWRGSVEPRTPAKPGARHVAEVGPDERNVVLVLPPTLTASVKTGQSLTWGGEADVEDVYSAVVLRREGERWVWAGAAGYRSGLDTFEADGLEVGERYAFWFDNPYDEQSRFGWVELTDQAEPPTLVYREGLSLPVTVTGLLPDDVTLDVQLEALDPGARTLRYHRQVAADGGFQIRGLRPGRYRVSLHQSNQRDRVLRAQGEADAGQPLALTLVAETKR